MKQNQSYHQNPRSKTDMLCNESMKFQTFWIGKVAIIRETKT